MKKNNMRRVGTIGLASLACVVLTTSCKENLPIGPSTFAASVQIVVPHDTIVVGDSSVATAKATDASGRQVLALEFRWSSADSSVVAFGTAADSEAASGRTRVLVGKKPGRAVVSVALPDGRFITSSTTRNQTVVVGGIKVLTSHDTTLTAINDTGLVVSTSLVKANGALVNKASLGIKWTHLGTHTTVVGTGDTIRYIAKSNGLDTLIATHDFCLVGARCADTVFARVGQLLSLSLSTHTFAAWSFGDSLGPTVTLSDRRGNGLAGTSVRFVPATAADSAIVRVSAPIGTSNPTTGVLAASQMIAQGNGTAKIHLLALLPDGFSVVAIDSVTETVRQVARRIAVEPLRAVFTANDSLPVSAVARDARGAVIKDATVSVGAINLILNGNFVGPTSGVTSPVLGALIPSLPNSIALPDSNPLAPQVAVAVDAANITMIKPDTVVADTTQRIISVSVTDSTNQPAAGKWVRFSVSADVASAGTVPDSVQLDAAGNATTTWTPPDSAGKYTLRGVRSTINPLATSADSAGRIVLLRSVVVKPVASAAKTSVTASVATVTAGGTVTITVTVRDRFGNIIKKATGTEFALSVTGGGTFGPKSCTVGVCTSTYTSGAAGAVQIFAKIGTADVLSSPVPITVTP